MAHRAKGKEHRVKNSKLKSAIRNPKSEIMKVPSA